MIGRAVDDMPEVTETGGHSVVEAVRDGDDEALEAVETELALLVRSLEQIRRRTPDAPSQALDRAVYLMLRTLAASGPSTVISLAGALGLDPSTAARQVAAMKRKGLVHTRPDPQDGRAMLVSPTPYGLGEMHAMQQARRHSIADLLADWPAADRATLARVLTQLNATIRLKRLQPSQSA